MKLATQQYPHYAMPALSRALILRAGLVSKCYRYLLVAALAELAFALPQSNPVPFSITISAGKGVFKAGSEVGIRLALKNTSTEEIPYVRGSGPDVEPHGEIFTDVKVRDAKGELAPETGYYRALRGKPDAAPPEPRPSVWGSFVGYMLKPGETREEEIVISRLYDLSQPGEYSVSASRRLFDLATAPRSKIVATSNTLTITITK